MNTDERRSELNGITETIIGCAYTVGKTLYPGYLEKVYENALAHELRKAGLKAEQQIPISVMYDGIVVGEFIADLLVEDAVMVELKAAKRLDDAHAAQCLNYLVATRLTVGLLINFGNSRVEVKRLVNDF
jgi:GxxExxY protein